MSFIFGKIIKINIGFLKFSHIVNFCFKKDSLAVRPTTAKVPRREGSSGTLTCGGGGNVH